MPPRERIRGQERPQVPPHSSARSPAELGAAAEEDNAALLVALQRAVGNRVVSRMFQREPSAGAAPAAPPSVRRAIERPGRALPGDLRAPMERLLGRDFRSVRVHTGPDARQAARAVDASGFAVGSHIVVGEDAAPRSPQALAGLAHELAHVAQQPREPTGPLMLGPRDDAAEREAERAGAVGAAALALPGGLAAAFAGRADGGDGRATLGRFAGEHRAGALQDWRDRLGEPGARVRIRETSPLGRVRRMGRAPERSEEERSGLVQVPGGPSVSKGPGYVRHPHGGVVLVPDVPDWYRSTRPKSGFKPGEAVGELVKTVVVGGVEYVVDLGRGVLHIGRYGKAVVVATWDPSELKELGKNDVAFIGLIYKIVTNPEKVLGTIMTGYAAAVAAEHELSEEQKRELEKSAKKAAKKAGWEFAQKYLGKWLVKKALITALVGPLLKRLAARISSELAKKVVTRAGGTVLLALSVLGLMEKAGEAAKRLKKKYPLLYHLLEPEGLHMAWFLIEPQEAKLRKQVESELRRRGFTGPLRGAMVKLTYQSGHVERRRVVRICTGDVIQFDPSGEAPMSWFRSIAYEGGTLRPAEATAADRARFYKAVGKQPGPC